jgi:Family of unknown function (DUF6529)
MKRKMPFITLLAGAAVGVVFLVASMLSTPPAPARSTAAATPTVFAIIQVGSALVMYGKIPHIAAPSCAFTIKMLILPKRRLPSWMLPVAGAVVFIVLTGVWLTSAYWFFSTFGIKH